MRYERLKQLERYLPAAVGDPLRTRWRSRLGDPEHHIGVELSDPAKITIDVGAGTGGFAEVLSKASVRCEAFEANPANWPLLQKNVAGMAVVVHECALSDKDGEVTFREPGPGDGEALAQARVEADNPLNAADVHRVDVPLRRLDALVLDPVGFK